MVDRTTRLRLRRQIRRSRRQVTGIGMQADKHLEKHIFRRMNRFADIARFTFGWLALLVILSAGVILQTRDLGKYYLSAQAVPGGIYSEGVLGTFTNANPIYAVGGVDAAVSNLLFSGLFTYSHSNDLTPNLAQSWQIDETEKIYAVTLKDDIVWHDGSPVTAKDVEFTYRTIQNPDAESPFFSSWQDIKIKVIDDKTITFTLPNVFAAFPYSLTGGILPKHLLDDVPPSELRSARFNNANPIGSGPFRWDTIELRGDKSEERQERIGLIANQDYHLGAPQVSRIILRTFKSEQQIIDSYLNKEIAAISGLNSIPGRLAKNSSTAIYNVPIAGQIGVFFKTSVPPLNDVKVRRALVQAADTNEALRELAFPVIASRSPLLASQMGYDPSILQLPYDKENAEKLLKEAGWVEKSPNEIRQKDGKPLSIRLFAQNTSEYVSVTNKLQRQWREVGINVEVVFQEDRDLQANVSAHNYDMVLYGVSIGPDPDVFSYWHSSQADVRSSNRLNLSEYESEQADRALEAARTRTDPKVRAPKYKPFLEAWRRDAPALMVYQPRFLYVVRGGIDGFAPRSINTAADRYNNIHEWRVRERLLPIY